MGLGLADQRDTGGRENRTHFRLGAGARMVGGKAQRRGVGPPGTELLSAGREGEDDEAAGRGWPGSGGPWGAEARSWGESPFHLKKMLAIAGWGRMARGARQEGGSVFSTSDALYWGEQGTFSNLSSS